MKTIRLRAVGDNLIHRQVYEAAGTKDGGFDFTGMYDRVIPLIREADIAVINQETILVADHQDVSSFPFFGSPMELGNAVMEAGFNVVTHATNHALDKGYRAIEDSVRFWEKHSDRILWAGIHTSREDYEKIRIVEQGGIRVAILNYTSPLNFHFLPLSHPYCVDVMKAPFKSRIRKQLQEARHEADIVAVFPHWGCEYLYEPVRKQTEWAAFLAENGADLIIGTHPHVLQNTEMIRTKDGREVPCLYSLGNFLSGQTVPGTLLGGMADIIIRKGDSGRACIEHADIIPLVTHADASFGAFSVFPLADYTDDLAAENSIAAKIGEQLKQKVDTACLWELYRKIRSKEALAESAMRTPTDVRRSNFRALFKALAGR